jgi:hypothetical protein
MLDRRQWQLLSAKKGIFTVSSVLVRMEENRKHSPFNIK